MTRPDPDQSAPSLQDRIDIIDAKPINPTPPGHRPTSDVVGLWLEFNRTNLFPA